jgi:hypothetical protein
MNARKYFYVLSGALALLAIAVIAAVAGGNALLEEKAKKLSDLKIEKATMEQQEVALRQAKIDIEKHNQLNEIAKSIVPQDKDQAKTIREIIQIGNETGVPIQSVTFESSNLGNTDKKNMPSQPSSDGSPTTKAPPVSQVQPVQGIPGVYTLEIKVSSDSKVNYGNFLRFLERLETNRRTAHVASINLSPSDNGTMVTFDLTLNAYLKPETK